MVAVGYVRRSKASKRDERTVSLEEQRARIEAYCQTQGWTLAEVVTDNGVSGGKRARLTRLSEVVKDRGAARVVCYHHDRFARDVVAFLDTLRAWSRRGVEVHVVGRGRLEVSSSSGFLANGVEALVAEHFRVVVGEKTRDALARLRDTGRRYTRILPYGARLAADGRLEPDPAEQITLGLARALAGVGLSLRAIARELAARSVVNRNGRPFAFQALPGMLRRQPIGLSVDSRAPSAAVLGVACPLPSRTRHDGSLLNRPGCRGTP